MPALTRKLFQFGFLFSTMAFISVLGNLLPAQETEFQLPTDPSAWLNSPPLTAELLEGKAAVLYFFEEG